MGIVGTNFERPSFQKMMKDIYQKKVNMVITKSLSRLGRDYIETGRLIEKIFPENDIRYIAILDDVDTLLDSTTDFVALKNLMNDFYAKETSKNVKKTKNRKREKEGFYYISHAPFGYKKIDIKGNIEIEEDDAKIVQKIFKEFINGKGTYQIANMLTDEGILTPGLKMGLPVAVQHQTETTKIWDCTQVRRILENPIYIGTVVQNKTRKINYKTKKKIKNNKEEYLYMENHHKAIIDLGTWNTTQEILNKKENQKIKESDELLKTFLYCAHCHNHLSIAHRKRNYKSGEKIDTYIICSTALNKKSKKICYHQYNTYHIVEEKVFENIKETIKEYLNSELFDNEKAINNLLKKQKEKSEIYEKLKKIDNEIDTLDEKIRILYNDRLNKMIEESDFILFFDGLKIQKEKVEKRKQEIQDEINQIEKENIKEKIEKSIKDTMEELLSGKKINKEILTQLIEKIEIDKDKNINIQYKFIELNCIGENIKYEKASS